MLYICVFCSYTCMWLSAKLTKLYEKIMKYNFLINCVWLADLEI